ncbi:MAG: threonine synthase [Proteobacteria bacterium]|nr:threonine synthase [Pseudomonadota bacterium]
MKYISTRDNNLEFSFEEVFLKGLADDGGLFIPVNIQPFSKEELDRFKKLDYTDLATEIIHPFLGSFITKESLKSLINKSYSTFREKEVVKLRKVGDLEILELFHGPTLAFKDVAMQFIGNLYEHYLEKNNSEINIVVATSGDTGAAAIDAIKNKKNLNIFVLHPNNKISSVQRQIMTTGPAKNVFNIAIEGNFDDCQNIVKSMFADLQFSKSINMSGVNSINWARIIAQAVYYFYSYFKINSSDKISFSVPTGNFGDVYAGYLAKKMGLPIDKLIVATNTNDILHRAISKGDYIAKKVSETISPSMDIQIASNFERLIYDISDKDSETTKEIMNKIKVNKYKINEKDLIKINKDFVSECINEEETLSTIKQIYNEYNLVIDPHTAIGVGALRKLNIKSRSIVLATAHPCKFPLAIEKAINKTEPLPDELNYILNEKEHYEILDNNVDKIKNYVKEKIS